MTELSIITFSIVEALFIIFMMGLIYNMIRDIDE